MKKMVILFLAVIMMLPAAALAAWPEGTAWVHSEMSANQTPYMEYLYLAEYGDCYYTTYMFFPDREAVGRTYNGYWTMDGSGNVYAKTGNNTEVKLTFSKDQSKAMDETNNNRIYYFVYTFDFN